MDPITVEDLKQCEGRTVGLVEQFEVERSIVLIFTFTDGAHLRLVVSPGDAE